MRHALQLPKSQKPAGPLDRVDRAENARKRLPVARILLQIHQFSVQPIQVFIALQQEFTDDLIIHACFLHLFRFGTRPRFLHASAAVLPIFFFCAHTIPSVNASAPTFPVHLTFQPDSFRRSRFRSISPFPVLLFSRCIPPLFFNSYPFSSRFFPPLCLYSFLSLPSPFSTRQVRFIPAHPSFAFPH